MLKTHYMVFHRAKHKNMDVKLCINKVPNQQVDNTKFLGVIIYDKLYAWLQSNKLTLNLLKTHYMVFNRTKHKKYRC